MIDRSSFRIDIIKIIKKELKIVTEKHSERIEDYKAKHRLEKLDGKKVYDKPVIRTGDKAGCYGSGLILLGSVLGIIYFLLILITDWDLKLFSFIWETLAALGIVFSLFGAFKIGQLELHSLSMVADKEKNFEIDKAFNLYNIIHKPTKKILLQYDSEDDSLISLNAGGELLVELLKRVEEEKLSFKAINKTLSLEELSENHWKIHYRYKRQDITLEKSDT